MLHFFFLLLLSGFAATPSTQTDELSFSVKIEHDVEKDATDHQKGSILSLKEALQYAYLSNPSLMSKRQQALATNEEIAKAYGGFKPKLEAQANLQNTQTNNSGSLKKTGSWLTDRSTNLSGELTLTQNIYKGGKTTAEIAQANKAIQSSWADVKAKEQEIFSKVIEAYFKMLTKQRELNIHRASVQLSRKIFEYAQKRFKQGHEAKTQLAISQAEWARNDAGYTQAKAEFEAYRYQLSALINKPVHRIQEENFILKIPNTLEECYKIAQKENPELIAARYDYEATKASIESARSELRPSLDIVAGASRDQNNSHQYHVGREAFNDSAHTTDYKTNYKAGLRLHWTLYDQGIYRAETRKISQNAAAKKVDIEEKRLKLIEEISKVWVDYISSKAQKEQNYKQAKAQEVRYQNTVLEINTAGTKLLFDLMQAQRDLMESKFRYVQSLYNERIAAYALIRLLGRLNSSTFKLNVRAFDPKAHYNRTKSRWF